MQKISLLILFCCLSIAGYSANKYSVSTANAPTGTASYCTGASVNSYSATWTGCQGTSAGTGTITYQWYNGSGAISPSIPGATGTFTITAANYSTGGTVTISATSMASVINTASPNTYNLNVKYSWGGAVTGCTSSANITSPNLTVTVHGIPSIGVSASSSSYCSGSGGVSLTASGGTSYTWLPDDGTLSATTGSSVNATPVVAESYTVTGTDAYGCVGTSYTSSIAVTPLSAVTISAAAINTCTGSTVTLSDNVAVQTADYEFLTLHPSSLTYAWTSTAGATAVLHDGASDDGSAPATIPFGFTFYGVTYTSVNINANGFINFSSPAYFYGSYGIPDDGTDGTPLNLIALFMHELDPDLGGTISYQTVGATPNRKFIVSYDAVPDYGAPGTNNTGQIILYEGSNNIDFMIGNLYTSANVTVGVQNGDGTVACFSGSENGVPVTLSSPEAWHFDASGAPSGGSVTYTWLPSGSVASSTTYGTTATVGSPGDTYTLTATDVASGCTSSATTTYTTTNYIWQGHTSSDWATGSNWACGSVPTATDNVFIPYVLPTYPQPVLAASTTGYGLNLTIDAGTGGGVTLSTGSELDIKGDVSNNAAVSGSGVLMLNGTSAQNLSGHSVISNLTLNNTSGATASNAAGDTVEISGVLTPYAGTLTTNGHVMLLSYPRTIQPNPDTVIINGTIGVIPGTNTTPFSGEVIVAQYVRRGHRVFRFIAQPYNTSISLSQIEPYIDITGPGGFSSGFTHTVTDSPSVFWYNPLTGNSTLGYDPGWRHINAINNAIDSDQFRRYEGLRFFIRGSKGEGLDGWAYDTSEVYYYTHGTLNTSRQAIDMPKGSSANQDYNMIGNPFAAFVDLGAVCSTNVAHLAGTAFFVWDPYIGTSGNYRSHNFTSGFYIGPNECFQVRTAHNHDSLIFNETDKAAPGVGASLGLMRQTPDDALSLNLYNLNHHLMDMFELKFSDEATDGEDTHYDAGKPPSPAYEQLYSLSADNTRLSWDTRPYADGKIVPLGLMTKTPMTFTFEVEHLPSNGGPLFLHDKLLQQSILLEQGTAYTFLMDSSVSQADSRFELRMGKSGNLVSEGGAGMQLLPNPATEQVTVNFTGFAADQAKIEVANIVGQVVLSRDMGVVQSGTEVINISQLIKGVYMVTFTCGKDKVVKRLVKE